MLRVCLLLSLCCTIQLTFCLAQENENQSIKIAVLDIEKIFREAKVAMFIDKKAEEKRHELQQIVEVYEKKLRTQKDALEKINKQVEKNYKQSQESFDKSTAMVQSKVSAKSKILEQIFNEARNKVLKNILDVVKIFAKEHKISFILPNHLVIYCANYYNITDKILAIIDKETPEIVMQFPELKAD